MNSPHGWRNLAGRSYMNDGARRTLERPHHRQRFPLRPLGQGEPFDIGCGSRRHLGSANDACSDRVSNLSRSWRCLPFLVGLRTAGMTTTPARRSSFIALSGVSSSACRRSDSTISGSPRAVQYAAESSCNSALGRADRLLHDAAPPGSSGGACPCSETPRTPGAGIRLSVVSRLRALTPRLGQFPE